MAQRSRLPHFEVCAQSLRVELEHRERERALASAGKQAAVFAGLAQEDGVSTTRGLLRLVQTETMMMLANHEGELESMISPASHGPSSTSPGSRSSSRQRALINPRFPQPLLPPTPNLIPIGTLPPACQTRLSRSSATSCSAKVPPPPRTDKIDAILACLRIPLPQSPQRLRCGLRRPGRSPRRSAAHARRAAGQFLGPPRPHRACLNSGVRGKYAEPKKAEPQRLRPGIPPAAPDSPVTPTDTVPVLRNAIRPASATQFRLRRLT